MHVIIYYPVIKYVQTNNTDEDYIVLNLVRV
jgi:hypothetical protein